MRLSTYFFLLLIGVLTAALAHADAGYGDPQRPGVSAPYPQQPPQQLPQQPYLPQDGCTVDYCAADSGPIPVPRAAAGVCIIRPVNPGYFEIILDNGQPLIGGNWPQIQGLIRHYLAIGVCRGVAQ